MFIIHSKSVEETLLLGERIGRTLKGGEVLGLSGELGSGKTVFVKGLARGLDIQEVITSPTFVLVKSYQGRLILHHIDFYRLHTLADLETIGFDDFLKSGGILAIEWAEKFPAQLPPSALLISIHYAGDKARRIEMKSPDLPGENIKSA